MTERNKFQVPGIVPSLADETDIELYTTGCCHWLALAIHRVTGWPMLVVFDHAEPFWQDPNDEDATISSVVHVYALSPEGEAWDVFGRRPCEAVREEAETRWHIASLGHERVNSEEELMEFVGCWGHDSDGAEIERPLPEYTEADISDAIRGLARLFPALPMPHGNLAPSMDNVDWERYGTVGDYVVWRNDDVYNVTAGDVPFSDSGYYDLESLLKLKGLRIADVDIDRTPVSTVTSPRF